ncbi:unnamed protein product [Phytomonas sp. Hart1]|nr:unnamed protein product [Phytomonas sp. Hart1]|eukprot:CCW70938.1 unnamed protein product [Phytomonas sp. isolate Hart1]
MSDPKYFNQSGYAGYGSYEAQSSSNAWGEQNPAWTGSQGVVGYASYAGTASYSFGNSQSQPPAMAGGATSMGLYNTTSNPTTTSLYDQLQQPVPTTAASGYANVISNNSAAYSTPDNFSKPTQHPNSKATTLYRESSALGMASAFRTSVGGEGGGYYTAPNQLQYPIPSSSSVGYPNTTTNSTNPPVGSPQDNAYANPISSSQGPASGMNAVDKNKPLNAEKLYHPRTVPNRSVDICSAPNPSRDIVYTTIPQEIHTSAALQPFSSVDFVGLDDGNANAKFIRLTQNPVFLNKTQFNDANIPFGAVLSPLHQPLHEAEKMPLVKDRPPIRCQRCRGYLSCHTKFVEMGKKWQCPLCGMVNPVEESFFCNLDGKGERVDRMTRPELCRGAVEYVVDDYPEYLLYSDKNEVIPSRPLHYLFLIDVSKAALMSFLPRYVEALEGAVERMAAGDPRLRVSFITFASRLHFYHFRDPRRPQFCVSDVDSPFVPIPFATVGWLEVGPELETIRGFLRSVLQYAGDLQETGCVVGAAVQAAMFVLAGQHGGRVILCAHQYPPTGLGAITPREQFKLANVENEKELLRPIEGFWKTTAVAAARQQISFDLFLFFNNYCELVTLSYLAHLTNGGVHLFSNYDPDVDGTKVRALMEQIAADESGYAGILRVRCSSGLTVQRYHGHFFSQTVHDMDLPNIGGGSTFFVEFAHEDELERQAYAYFQVALLYTTRGGSRRVRIQSVRATTANNLSHAFTGSDLEAVLAGFIYKSLDEAVNKGLKHAREYLNVHLVNSLANYRRFCTKMSNSKALLMPSRLRLLALYILCLLKSDALAEGTGVRIDERSSNVFKLLSMPMNHLLSYFYPALYSLHDTICEGSGYGVINEITQRCNLPPRLQLIYDNIVTCGVYLLSDEQVRVVYMWIGSKVTPEVSQLLFGVPDVEMVYRGEGSATFDNFDPRIQNIICALTYREDGMRRLVVIHQGERSEEAFFKQLKEEKESSMCSYDEWLSQLHTKVRNSII